VNTIQPIFGSPDLLAPSVSSSGKVSDHLGHWAGSVDVFGNIRDPMGNLTGSSLGSNWWSTVRLNEDLKRSEPLRTSKLLD